MCEARDLCQDRVKRRSVVFAYPSCGTRFWTLCMYIFLLPCLSTILLCVNVQPYPISTMPLIETSINVNYLHTTYETNNWLYESIPVSRCWFSNNKYIRWLRINNGRVRSFDSCSITLTFEWASKWWPFF